MSRRPPVGLGDLLGACAELAPDPATRAALARLLGYTFETPPEARVPDRPVDAPNVPEPRRVSVPSEVSPLEPPGRRQQRRVEGGIELDPAPSVPPPIRLSRQPLARPAAPFVPPEPEPLFEPRKLPAIVTAALATRAPVGEPDTDALVDAAARCSAVTALPRLPVWTLGSGARVLVDRGESMAPFADDLSGLVARLTTIVGAHRLEVETSFGTPAVGSRPGRGTPILVLSDLALPPGPPEGSWSSWARFAGVATRGGSPVVAFVPRGRWPRAWARRLAIVRWDRATRVGHVRRAREVAS